MAVALKHLYTPQASALTHSKRVKTPLAAIVHAELPAKVEAGRYQAHLDLSEKELAQDREHFAKTYGLEKEKMGLEEARFQSNKVAARKAEGIQTAGLGVSAGMSLAEMYKDYLKDPSKALPGAKHADLAVGPVAGFGVGYGVKKYTGSTSKAIGAGTAAALAGDYLARGESSIMGSIWSAAKGLWGSK